MEEIIHILKEYSGDYSRVPLSHRCNTLPYGNPTNICYETLVVIIDGKFDLSELISKSLLHVGNHCLGITKNVLFYVDIYRSDWDVIWNIFAPSFQALEKKHNINLSIYFATIGSKSNGLDPSSFFGKSRSKTAINKRKLCPFCNQRPATEERLDTWSMKTVWMCSECSQNILF